MSLVRFSFHRYMAQRVRYRNDAKREGWVATPRRVMAVLLAEQVNWDSYLTLRFHRLSTTQGHPRTKEVQKQNRRKWPSPTRPLWVNPSRHLAPRSCTHQHKARNEATVSGSYCNTRSGVDLPLQRLQDDNSRFNNTCSKQHFNTPLSVNVGTLRAVSSLGLSASHKDSADSGVSLI